MAATAVADGTRAPRTRHPHRSHAGNVAAAESEAAAAAVRDDDDDDMDGNSVLPADVVASTVAGLPLPRLLLLLTVTRTTWTRMWPPAWAALVAAVAVVAGRVYCLRGVLCRCCCVSDDCCCCGRCCRQLERRCRRFGCPRHYRGRVCCATTIARECLRARRRKRQKKERERDKLLRAAQIAANWGRQIRQKRKVQWAKVSVLDIHGNLHKTFIFSTVRFLKSN